MPRRFPALIASWMGLALFATWAAAGCGGCRGDNGAVADGLKTVIATCAASAGEVHVRRVGQVFWEPTATGSSFRRGDWVRTGPLSSARIEFLERGRLQVDERSTVVVDLDVIPSDDGAPQEAVVAVKLGGVSGVIEAKAAANGFPLSFQTPEGNRLRIANDGSAGDVVFQIVGTPSGAQVAIRQGVAKLRIDQEPEVQVPAGQTAELSARRLHFVKTPDAPIPVEPAPHARLRCGPAAAIDLVWQATPHASGYRVQVSADASFDHLELSERVTATRFPFTAPRLGSFVWRVAAFDARGRSSVFTDPARFTCGETIPADLLVAPERGKVVGTADATANVSFSWRPSDPAPERYRLVVTRAPCASATSMRVERSVDHPEAAVSLKPGSYCWQVFAEGEPATPLAAQPWPFTVRVAAKPRLVAPNAIDEWGK